MASITRLVGGFNNPLDLLVSHQYGNIDVWSTATPAPAARW